jgi:hypothetical protein
MKFQITLPDDLALELKETASRLREKKTAASGDPFASITGLVDAPDTDRSATVDEILYKWRPL